MSYDDMEDLFGPPPSEDARRYWPRHSEGVAPAAVPRPRPVHRAPPPKPIDPQARLMELLMKGTTFGFGNATGDGVPARQLGKVFVDNAATAAAHAGMAGQPPNAFYKEKLAPQEYDELQQLLLARAPKDPSFEMGPR